ncbi:MAG: Tetratricopeptide repeat [Verrucomicrobiota bacterium]|jgi:tetratricopeptide (TPR) repeat protein
MPIFTNRSRPAVRLALAGLILLLFIGLLVGLFHRFASVGPLQKVRHNGETYFRNDPDFGRRLADRGTQQAIPPVWVSAARSPGVRRVVLLGGSAAAGFPMTCYHLGRVIEARWRARFPSEPLEAVNLSAGGGAGAWRESVDAAMALEPDMIVLYAEEDAVSGDEAGVRGLVDPALTHGVKVLFVLPATKRTGASAEENKNDFHALHRKIAGESVPAIATIDADRFLHGENPTRGTDDEIFLDDSHLTFAGRVAVAESIVDGMAALWGIAPRDESPEAAAWWRKFPQAENEARRDMLFTGYDEHDMWSLVMKQAEPSRRALLEEKVRDLRRRAALGWDTTDIIVAYERAQLQNPRDPLTHFTAGRLLGLRGEGERAEEAFSRGFALQPDNTAALLDHAAMQTKRGDIDSARASLDILQKYDSQAEGLLKMQAAVALREAELPEAAALLQKHLDSNPGDSEAWLTLSEIQLKLGDFPASDVSRQSGKDAAVQ